MKRSIFYLVVLLLMLLSFNKSGAQYVTISDANFVSWLNTNGYANCLSGNQLDTTCPAVLNATYLQCSELPISDITGIQYFKNLDTLKCVADALTFLPNLPGNLKVLMCDSNNITYPPILPDSLRVLTCSYNPIVYFWGLPSALRHLECYNSQLNSLPALPDSLTYLLCGSNQLDSLPLLPITLDTLSCWNNNIVSLPDLPANLKYLDCNINPITVLPPLPAGLTLLNCSNNHLDSLPVLPAALITFSCDVNHITTMPALPPGLRNFTCSDNQLASLPVLPSSVVTLYCGNNLLTSLPAPAQNMYIYSCANNPGVYCMPVLTNIQQLDFSGTNITCLPNYGTVQSSTPTLSSLPLCSVAGSNCPGFTNISGSVVLDTTSNCSVSANAKVLSYIPVQLLTAGNVIQQTFTGGAGLYSFSETNIDTYQVAVDTAAIPFYVTCPTDGLSSMDTVTIDSADAQVTADFIFNCKPGFDIAALSLVTATELRPLTNTQIYCGAGDMASFYHGNCAAGLSGSVQLIMDGPVHYQFANGTLQPTNVSGDTVTWQIADYGTVNFFNDFNVMVAADSSAQSGDSVCVTLIANPVANDNNPVNNNITHCFTVVNSHDPNRKEVSPAGNIIPGQWLTYTVHFQNTGSAAALHVLVKDTLDNSLDISTFKLLAYSSPPQVTIANNHVAQFQFYNINLPDSATDPTGSQGYVQYGVRAKSNIALGTNISNTAYIFFDYNDAVATNTVNNSYMPTGVNEVSQADVNFSLIPNPTHNEVTIVASRQETGSVVEITDALGRTIIRRPLESEVVTLSTSQLAGGIYLVKLTDSSGIAITKKLVKQ